MRTTALIISVAALVAISGGASAQTASAQSPGAAVRPLGGPSTAEGAGLRLLSWPGKVQRPTAARTPPRLRSWTADPSPAYRPLPVKAPPQVYEPASTQAPAPPVRAAPTQAVQAVQAQPLAPPAPPTSIYAPPPPPTPPIQPSAVARTAPPVRALASAEPVRSEDLRPRLYSVHRPFGAEPDPIVLTPQFLGQDSADLAQPPPPIPRATVNAAGKAIRPAPPPPEPAI